MTELPQDGTVAEERLAAWLLLSGSDEADVPPSDVDEEFSIPDSV